MLVDTRRRRWPWVTAAFAAAFAAFVLVWFEPQKLFIDERVDDPAPSIANDAPDASRPGSGDGRATPAVIADGAFVSLDHGTSGRVRVLEVGDGDRVVRLEGLDTSNGPDLYLYATANPSDGDEGAFDDDFVNLGRLKGNLGDQNYDLPPSTDLTRYRTVVIWCDRFDSAFGAADLNFA